ncbi:sciellin isoform X3 [Leucoraja erinacea]|uniref:sciellin isoform X3 n=1 Tax=Leucoraja erinaceus TaxID=7782 RepID=UPI0024554E20|nr:sciellin isoform X3 [Leucoraja erinacea]
MSVFKKLTDAFSTDKPATSGERDQVIRETTKKTRLMKDQEWIKNKGDDSQNTSVDVNYGKKALNPVKAEGNPFRDSTGSSKVTPTKRGDTLDGRKSGSTTDLRKAPWTSSQEKLTRDKESTDVTSPSRKYSSSDRLNRLSTGNSDDLPKMTIVSSETKFDTPSSKRPQTRPSPDGQVTTQDKTSTTPILKWDNKKDETLPNVNTSKPSTLERKSVKTPTKSEPLIDLTPTTQKTSKGSSDILPKVESKSLIDLSVTSDKTNESRNSGDWGNTNSYTTSTKTTFDPKAGSDDWTTITSSTTSSTKSSIDNTPKKPSRNSGDWEKTNSYTTSTKTTFDPNSGSDDWTNITSSTTSSTKSSIDNTPKKSRSTSEKDLLNDESPYKSPTSYTKTSKTYSYNSNNDQSPAVDEPYSSRSSYKENSPYDDDESSSYQSSNYSLPKPRSSSSSLSDGKSPAQVITLTTAYTSAGQTTKDKNVCSQCYKPFNGDPKMILEDLNINCHASCLKCQICNRSLEDLSAGDNLWVHHHTVHCERCYDNAKAQLGY